MTFHNLRALTALSLLALSLLGVAGCDNGGSNAVANIRVFNGLAGSANVGGVNVRLRQASAVPVTLAPVGFGGVSPNQQRATGDAQDTFLFLANNAQMALAVQKFDYPRDNVPTNSTGELLVAKGVVGQTSGEAAPGLIYVRTSVPLPIIRQGNSATTNSLLRIVNAAPGSGSITLFNEQGPVPFPDLSNISFGNVSSGGNTTSNFATITAANYNLTVRGTVNGQPNQVLATLPNVTFQPGNAYTLVVYGSANPAHNAPITAIFVQDYPLP